MAAKLSKADAKFTAALVAAGGELLAPTNPYEIMRFKTRFGVGVVYENGRGVRTWNSEAKQVRDHLASQKGGTLAPVIVRGRRTGKGTVVRLMDRDGAACFFCGVALETDVTIEHLVPVAHGGPNHISNLFLAHADCNQQAGHLSAPEKVAIAICARSSSPVAPAQAPFRPERHTSASQNQPEHVAEGVSGQPDGAH